MLKKKTERLIPQSDQPKKQVSRGKVTVPKNSKQNALSTEKNSLDNRKTAKKPTAGKKNSRLRLRHGAGRPAGLHIDDGR